MKINYLLIVLTLIFTASTSAQDFALGKVSIQELQEKNHPSDSAAVAAVLFEVGKVTFEYSQSQGFTVVTDVTAKIKIYKKEGYEWANKNVSYYSYNNAREKVAFADAVTYNLVNGKIEKTKLKSDGEFDEEVNKYWSRKKIVLPSVKEGCIIEYRYVVRSPRLAEIRDWNFQSTIPVNYSELEMAVPEYFVYQQRQKGFVFPKRTVVKSNKYYVINNKERDFQGAKLVRATFSSDKLDYLETRTKYVASHLRGLKEEAYVNNMENYNASVSHELASTQFPGEPYKLYSSDWDAVAKSIYQNEDFDSELNKSGYFEEDLTDVLSKVSSNTDKINVVFDFVKDRVKLNNFYGYTCNDGVKKAYKDRTGNVAEINLMLTAMLRYAGLSAQPVLVSTRSNGIALFPSRAAFNYVIAAVETPEGYVLLDATDKFSYPGVLPMRDLNWNGRLIRKDGSSEWINLMPKKLSNNTLMMNYSVENSGKIVGKLKGRFTDYQALSFRDETDNVSEDNYLEKLENENNSIEVSDYKRENQTNLTAPIVESYSFKGSNFSEIINDKIYFKPLLFFTVNENPFKQESREFPVDYAFPFLNKYIINIDIPAGYKIEQLPASGMQTMQNDLGSFKFVTSATETKIQIMVTNQINEAIVPSDAYKMIKDYYQGMVDKQNEKIVLVKI
jgi:hypothetical protein